jgi:hypothetical protein
LLVFFLGSINLILIFSIIETALLNKVSDIYSWGILIAASMFLCWLSFSKFKYFWITQFKTISFVVNEQGQAIEVLPFREVVKTENVKEFVYNNYLKSYVFRYSNGTSTSIEVIRNYEFENLMAQMSMEIRME